MKILGISAFYHDSAAALVVDSEIVAAAQEERFTRIKHDSAFPTNAINFCLKQAGISAADLDYVVYYEKPLLKLERLLENYVAFAPFGFNSLVSAISEWSSKKIAIKRSIQKNLKGFCGKNLFLEHHESHAASAFFPSPYEKAAVITMDGVGEWATSSIGIGDGNKIRILKELKYPHSLGLLYSAFTYFTGFRVNSGEYKLMGLAPYGKPIYADIIREKIVKIYNDGSIQLDLSYFNYCQGLTMTGRKFDKLFGGPPRKPESPITAREMDIAASIQVVTEEIMQKMAQYAKELTGCDYLCIAGGVALNCSSNGKLQKEKIFKDIWVQPASGDAGGALGAALFVNYQLLNEKRKANGQVDFQKGSFLGNSYASENIRNFLDQKQVKYHHYYHQNDLMEYLSEALEQGKVIGLFQGRMEYGPRALGGRSIIGNPMISDMQSRINLKIKFRESFRPFAPAVLAEDAEEYFDFDAESPYMLMVAPVNQKYLIKSTDKNSDMQDHSDLLKRLNVPRSKLQAITHIDNSARLQTVDKKRNPFFYDLLKTFKKKTGCPVLVNTSFNIRGEPIVCSPADALNCYYHTDMDILVLEDVVVTEKNNQIQDAESYKNTFKLD